MSTIYSQYLMRKLEHMRAKTDQWKIVGRDRRMKGWMGFPRTHLKDSQAVRSARQPFHVSFSEESLRATALSLSSSGGSFDLTDLTTAPLSATTSEVWFRRVHAGQTRESTAARLTGSWMTPLCSLAWGTSHLGFPNIEFHCL